MALARQAPSHSEQSPEAHSARAHESSAKHKALHGKHETEAHKGKHAAGEHKTKHAASEHKAKHPASKHKTKHKPKKHKKAKKHRKTKHTLVKRHLAGAAGAPVPTIAPAPPAPSSAPVAVAEPTISLVGARRLLWRAGFGPTPGQAEGLAGQPLQQVVYGLTRPAGAASLNGPEPVDEEGHALAPADVWGEDHCWWLDRMIRSDQQLVERMTFIWHDWFANSNVQVNSQQLMLNQNQLFREKGLGSFPELFQAVTTDPAMLLFLNGIYNTRWEPNENYAREMMELFSLGADRGAYTEDDVREMARALTGWTAEWSSELGYHDFHFEASRHDPGTKTVFGQSGNYDYTDAVDLCVNHPLHPSYFVTKLWGYFIPTVPDEATLASLQGLYTSSGFSIRAVVEAILQHPEFYDGPELVTPPVVFNAGLMRAAGRFIDNTSWAWLSAGAGQQLFYPPNVSGWDFTRWLDTSTAKARWEISTAVTSESYVDPWSEAGSSYDPNEDGATALTRALAYWGNPVLSEESQQSILNFAETCLASHTNKWELSSDRAIRQNALRMLIATSPDLQVS